MVDDDGGEEGVGVGCCWRVVKGEGAIGVGCGWRGGKVVGVGVGWEKKEKDDDDGIMIANT